MPLKSAGKTITKIKQNKKTIDVYFGLEKISVPFDSYFDSFLYQGKLLTDKEYNDLIFASKNSSLYVYASTVLKKYKYTESMMREKLSIRETNEETVDKIIKKLKKALFIDDKAFIKDYLDLSEDKNIGKNRIIKFLRDKGIKEEDINNINFSQTKERNKAVNQLRKLDDKYDGLPYEKKKRRIYSSLVGLGFDPNLTFAVLNEMKEKDIAFETSKIKSDYKKIKKRLSKKYSGYELQTKLAKELHKKGYSYPDIRKLTEVTQYDD